MFKNDSDGKPSAQMAESDAPIHSTPQQPQPSTSRRTMPRLDDEVRTASETTSSGLSSPCTPPVDQQKLPSRKKDSGKPSAAGAEDSTSSKPRQVIAVSASRGPAAFFNLARKFLVTDEMCDLSALEGAIVSAVDAAHLLERSKLATIVRVQTSYVTVEPKRRKQQPQEGISSGPSGRDDQRQRGDVASLGTGISGEAAAEMPSTQANVAARARGPAAAAGRELRRARIVITVQRTESYEQWLEENPLQAIIASDDDDEGDAGIVSAAVVANA